MIENLFKEQFGKNNILSNVSNIQEILHYDNFSGLKEISLRSNDLTFGLVYLDIKNIVSEISVIYNNVIVFKSSENCVKIIPIKFMKEGVLQVAGQCGELNIHIYGSSILCGDNNHIMPMNNIVVSKAGNTSLYSYSSVGDILNNNLSLLNTFDNKSFVQTYYLNGEVKIGCLSFNNGVYFCNNTDNYASNISISESAEQAIFLQNDASDSLNILYIKNNIVYCKVLYADQSVSDELEISVLKGMRPVQLSVSVIEGKSGSFFAVRFDKDVYCVYCLKDDFKFEKVFETKAKNLRLFENVSKLIIMQYSNYSIEVMSFKYDKTKYSSDILKVENKTIYNNVVDYLTIENNSILTSVGGVKYLVEENE